MQTDKMSVAENPIDVWNVGSFDQALIALLESRSALVRNYYQVEREIILSHDLSRDPERPILRPKNPHGYDFYALKEGIWREMRQRVIRAFHYTRLTDVEVETLTREGIHLSTPSSLQRRLENMVRAGCLG